MSDIAVIYASHYGFTEAYARWLAEDLSADLLESGKVKKEDLEGHGTIVCGGGLYAGGVNGLSKALPPQLLETMHIYHLRGGLRYSKMSMVHRTMMAMLRKVLLKKPEAELRSEDRALLETYGQDVSFLDRDSIAPLAEDIRRGAEQA